MPAKGRRGPEDRPVAVTRSWREGQAWKAELLRRRTGHDVAWWNERIEQEQPVDEAALRKWLKKEGVTGYPLDLLVMERFGYPDFLTRSPEELIADQYADRPAPRPILDRLLQDAAELGDITVQTRKGYISLVTPRRTFASIQPTTKTRIDLGLRLPDAKPTGRLEVAKSIGQSQMTHKVELSSPKDVDSDVRRWLGEAYEINS